jgi:hypothetical protein
MTSAVMPPEGPDNEQPERAGGPSDAPTAGGFRLNERDRIIQSLNHQGLSNRAISRTLLETYGIQLAETSVRRHLVEMYQDPDNDIRLNFEASYRKPREQKRWYNIVLQLQKMIPAYSKRMGYKPSARTMFYALQDLGLVKPEEESAYNRAVVHARLQYRTTDDQLEYAILPLDCFAEDKTRESIDNYDDSEPQEMIEPGDIPDHNEIIQEKISDVITTIYGFEGVGEEGFDAKPGGYWYGQPKYIELWEEKNDLLPGFDKILKEKYIKIRANKGFSSLDYLRQCTIELKELIESKGLNQELVYIGYCGDCDPSGMEMIYYVKKRLKTLGIPNVNFEPIAVTPEQITKYKLRLMSIKRPPGKKADDPNLKEFQRLNKSKGLPENLATHLNAFFTPKHIKAFEKIVLAWVDSHHDKKIYDDMVEEYGDTAPDPESMTDDEVVEARDEMWEKVKETFCKPKRPRQRPDSEEEGEGEDTEHEDEVT